MMPNAQENHPDWTIRPYQPGDEAHLVRLFERSFDHTITEAHWRWKLKHLPSPVENVWLAVHGGTPIFHYGGIPCRFHLPGGERVAMVSVDGMTAPEFRRRGILTHAGQFIFDAWQDAGIPFTLGLPNEQWGSRTTALGWKTLFPLQWLVRPLRPTTLLARRLRVPFLAHRTVPDTLWNRFWNRTLALDPTVDVDPVYEAGPAFDHLWRGCASEIKISVVRDRAWVTWRYLAAPSIDYRVLLATRARQPVGYLAYRIKETPKGKLGFIAEVFTPPAEERGRATLVRHALDALQGEAVDAVFTLATPKTPLFRFFRRAGFVFSPGAFMVRMIPLATTLPIETFRNPHHWYLAGGDFDVV
jgi:hypothetical protein